MFFLPTAIKTGWSNFWVNWMDIFVSYKLSLYWMVSKHPDWEEMYHWALYNVWFQGRILGSNCEKKKMCCIFGIITRYMKPTVKYHKRIISMHFFTWYIIIFFFLSLKTDDIKPGAIEDLPVFIPQEMFPGFLLF